MATLKEIVTSATAELSLQEALPLLQPLLLFLLGIAVYSLFIFKFYRFVARREIFEIKKKEGKTSILGAIWYIIKYILLFPIFTFFWFLVLTIILAFLSKGNDIQTVLLISIALVAVIRVMAYYDEDLSKDLAKMLPFALLGVFLVDITYFSASTSLETIKLIPASWRAITYYLVFIIILEFLLRMLYGISSLFRKNKEQGKISNH
jgi:hypothetical protein